MKKLLTVVFMLNAVLAFAQDTLFEVNDEGGNTIFSVTTTGVKIFNMKVESEGNNIWFSTEDGNQLFTVTESGINVHDSFGRQVFSTIDGLELLDAEGDTLFLAKSNFVRFFISEPDPNADESRGGFAVATVSNLGDVDDSYDFLNLTPDNYFIGHESGMNNDEGLYNNFLGYQAGRSNVEGYYNTFIGYQSGFSNIGNDPNLATWQHGQKNTFVGFQSGYSNTMGDKNTFIGSGAGYNNLNANYNVFIGSNTGFNNTEGPYNTFVGTNSGQYNSTGHRNSLFGYQAGLNNTTGQKNTYMGVGSGSGIATGNENVFIGYDTCAYGLSYGNDGTGSNNVAVGFQAGFSSLYGDGNVFLGSNAGYNETGSNKLYISNSTTSSPLIYGDFTYGSEQVVINGNAGHNSMLMKLFVNGMAGGPLPWMQFSDRRLKQNIAPIDHALQKIKALEGVSFEWIDQENLGSERQIGFIAQDVEKILPEVVVKSDDHYAMQYAPITALLVQAIKEQQEIISSSESKIDNLEQRLSELEEIIKNLKK